MHIFIVFNIYPSIKYSLFGIVMCFICDSFVAAVAQEKLTSWVVDKSHWLGGYNHENTGGGRCLLPRWAKTIFLGFLIVGPLPYITMTSWLTISWCTQLHCESFSSRPSDTKGSSCANIISTGKRFGQILLWMRENRQSGLEGLVFLLVFLDIVWHDALQIFLPRISSNWRNLICCNSQAFH